MLLIKGDHRRVFNEDISEYKVTKWQRSNSNHKSEKIKKTKIIIDIDKNISIITEEKICAQELLIKEKKLMINYFKKMKYYLMTTRFNNATWKENREYLSMRKKGMCIYCSPVKIVGKITINSIMFILEMNNDINKIIGIGLVLNNYSHDKYFVYKNGNYNRYVFRGSQRIDRSDMSEDELIIISALDIFCFTSGNHLKRGNGIQLFPIRTLVRCLTEINILEFIMNMFKVRQ